MNFFVLLIACVCLTAAHARSVEKKDDSQSKFDKKI
jgi:hypothetical protein